jgi:RNA polymerase sigma-70 factor, ECF subfamily
MVQWTDSHILNALQKGDNAAFEHVFLLHYESLCRYGSTLLKDPDAAEEVVQQIFYRLWEKKEELVIEKSLKVYLFRAVHNASLNVIKHGKVRRRYQELQLKTANSSAWEIDRSLKTELQQKIVAAMDELPPQCGLIFKMSRLEEKKYAEIAEELTISVKTVENQMGKALALMRKSLSEYLTIIFSLVLLRELVNIIF